jgi:hypothetical protein
MNAFQAFWALFVLVPLTIAWAFAVFDIFRRDDLSGWGKAAWFAAVIVLPWIGTFLYLLFRPREIPREVARAEAHLLLTIGSHTAQGVAAPTMQGVTAPTH